MTKKSKTKQAISDIEMIKDFEDGTKAICGVNHLHFGRNKVLISNEEMKLLEIAYKEYLELNAVSIGFIHSLVGYKE